MKRKIETAERQKLRKGKKNSKQEKEEKDRVRKGREKIGDMKENRAPKITKE